MLCLCSLYFFILNPLSSCLLVKNTNKGKDALSNMLCLRSLYFFVLNPLSSCLLVKNTNKGEVCYAFVHSIYSSVILFHLVCW